MANNPPSPAVVRALAVTVELTGGTITPTAAEVLADDLAGYPEQQVLGALKRIRLDGVKVTVGNIIARLDDGRPGAEEAFAMLPRSESETVAMSDEMAEAFNACRHMIDDGDMVAARMTFKEVYQREIAKAREAKKPPRWFPSLGTDPNGRERALTEAVQRGRLPASAVAGLLPYQQTMLEAQGKDMALLPSTAPSQKHKQFLAELKKIVMKGKVGNG